MIFEAVSVGSMEVNCYILAQKENERAVIIDPGAQPRKIRKVLEKHKLAPGIVINTHGHFDHIGADNDFNVPVYVHEQDAAMLKDAMLNMSGLFAVPFTVKAELKILEDNQVLEFGGIKLKVMHTPGHTRGGISLLLLEPEGKKAFTGDTLFCRGVGRSDLNGGSPEELSKSIREKLFTLPDETRIYPGHGPSSTIGAEKIAGLI
ncbi:MAG: MBL fold metallo-hydrolase [Candidatus Omnitrophota bacterium]